MKPLDEMFPDIEAARRIGLSVATLRRRRLLRQPPAYVKLGGRVLYRARDLDAFVEANLVLPEMTAKDGARGGK